MHGNVLKGLAAGLLGTADFGAEAIARKAGKGIRRSLPAVGAAGGTAAVMKKKDEPMEQEKSAFWDSFKQAFDMSTGAAGALGGAVSGYHSGRSAAGTTANAISRKGFKTKNEETARNIAKVTGIAGAVGGLALGLKHKRKIIELARKHISAHPDMHQLYEAAVPFLAGTGGGVAAGVATGAGTSLRGAFSRKKEAGAITSLVGTVTGVKDVHRGYKLIDKLVSKGHILQSGAATSVKAEARKALAGKAMAGGLGRMTATGLGAAYLLRKKDGGQAQGY